MWQIEKTDDFIAWFDGQNAKIQAQIDARLARIQYDGHFGVRRWLGDGLWELKFNNGNRIYYTQTGKKLIILLYGGSKHGQEKDIRKAKSLLA